MLNLIRFEVITIESWWQMVQLAPTKRGWKYLILLKNQDFFHPRRKVQSSQTWNGRPCCEIASKATLQEKEKFGPSLRNRCFIEAGGGDSAHWHYTILLWVSTDSLPSIVFQPVCYCHSFLPYPCDIAQMTENCCSTSPLYILTVTKKHGISTIQEGKKRSTL